MNETGEFSDHNIAFSADYSLRSNGDTYIDRMDESERIIMRIKTSSSSVLGISGVRGAGKSSLAMKVLKYLSETGHFTILISSPVAYDSKEFLLMIYQSVAEKVRIDLATKIQFKLATDKENANHLRNNRLIKYGTLFLWGVVLLISTFYTADFFVSNNEKSTLLNFKSQPYFFEIILKDIFFTALMLLVIYGLQVLVRFIIARINHAIWQIKNFPKEMAVYRMILTKLEWLGYQSKLTSSREASLPVSSFSAKFSKSRELQERPMSLPGLTADFNDFIVQVAAIYQHKVVICIDELDKIGTFSEIEALLKGIKGIIGQQYTHYLLTISEDALQRFTTRLRKQRDIMESSFEDILILNRVDKGLTQKMILNVTGLEEISEEKTMLIWLFSNGIPREIKRALMLLRNKTTALQDLANESMWFWLISESATAAQSWALMDDNTEYETNRLLVFLEHLTLSFPADMPAADWFTNWYQELINACNYSFPESIIFREVTKENATGFTYDRLLLELFVRALTLQLLNLGVRSQREYAARLMYIIDVLPYNTIYAAAKLQRLLGGIGITIPTESTKPPMFHVSL